MHLLHNNLGPLADLAGKEKTKFAMTGVNLEILPDRYKAVATNSKLLGVVEGPLEDAEQYPEIPGLKSAPNGGTRGNIPSEFWKSFFAKAVKMTKKIRYGKEILKFVPVVVSENQTTMATTDLEQVSVEASGHVEGRFPPYQEVFPRSKPLVKIRVDADLLIDLLDVAKRFCTDGYHGVDLVIHDPTKPIEVNIPHRNDKGQSFRGLVMPLAGSDDTDNQTSVEKFRLYDKLLNFAIDMWKKAKLGGSLSFDENREAKSLISDLAEPRRKELEAMREAADKARIEREAKEKIARLAAESAEKEAQAVPAVEAQTEVVAA